MLSIGSCKIPSKILLAPLAGCSDLAFRLIAREHGAKFCFFEMVDNNSVIWGPRHKTISILKTVPEDSPIAAQLLGREPSKMLKAAREIMELADISFLDINAACPAKKAIKKKTGAYLINDLKTLQKVIHTLAAGLPIPVTVKIRTGFNETDLKSLVKFAKGCESAGASAIFVHGRTRAQDYSGGINYDAIRIVKESVGVPVIGSGNIFDADGAEKMLALTGCDAILVARGAFGNPWIFNEIECRLAGHPAPKLPSFNERIETLKKHLGYIQQYHESNHAGKVGYMRKFVLWYLKGFPNAASLRAQISIVKEYDGMLELLHRIAPAS